MRTIKSNLLRLPMRLVLLAGMAALFAFTATTASAGLLYNPVVVVAEGPAGTDSGSLGVATSISIYKQGVANQAAPISTTAYNSGATGTRLVTGQSELQEGYLTNNPGVSNAAAIGTLFGGTQYVYNAGYDNVHGTASVKSTTTTSGTGVNSPRAFGQTEVTGSVASNATVLQTQLVAITDGTSTRKSPYDNASIRGATVSDDSGSAATRFTGGTATSSTTISRATGGWRNFTTNTKLSGATTGASSTILQFNVRSVELLGGTLFGTKGSSGSDPGAIGIYAISGTVPPANAPIYLETGADSSPHEFALFDDPLFDNGTGSTLNLGYDTAYIADEDIGAIRKYTWNGAVWTLAYTLSDTVPMAYFGLAGQLDPVTNLITLYTSGEDETTTKLKQVTDMGSAASSPFTTLASLDKAGGSFFHGVALAAVPEPSALLLGILACGAMSCATGRRRWHV